MFRGGAVENILYVLCYSGQSDDGILVGKVHHAICSELALFLPYFYRISPGLNENLCRISGKIRVFEFYTKTVALTEKMIRKWFVGNLISNNSDSMHFCRICHCCQVIVKKPGFSANFDVNVNPGGLNVDEKIQENSGVTFRPFHNYCTMSIFKIKKKPKNAPP